MAGKLSWALTIEGIPAAVSGLKELDATIISIIAHMRQMGDMFSRMGGFGRGNQGYRGGGPAGPFYAGPPGGTAASMAMSAGLLGGGWKGGGPGPAGLLPPGGSPHPMLPPGPLNAPAAWFTPGGISGLLASPPWASTGSQTLKNITGASLAATHPGVQESASAQVTRQRAEAQAIRENVAAAQRVKQQQALGFPLSVWPWQRPGEKGWPFSGAGLPGPGAVRMMGPARQLPPGMSWAQFQQGALPFTGGISQYGSPIGPMPRPPVVPPPLPPWITGGQAGAQYGQPIGPGLAGGGGNAWTRFMYGFKGGAGGGFFGGGGRGLQAITGGGGLEGFLKAIGTTSLALFAITVAASKLKQAFERLMEIYREGARLYQSSARIGTTASNLYEARRALGAAGVDPETADRLALMAQFGRRAQGQRVNIAGLTLAARRAGDQGTLQQILNMRGAIQSEANSPWVQMESAQRQESVPAFQKIYELSHQINEEWKSLKDNIAFGLADSMKGFLYVIKEVLQVMNGIAFILQLMQKLQPQGTGAATMAAKFAFGGVPGTLAALGGMIPNAPPAEFGRAMAGGMMMGKGAPSPWERMGFQFTGAASGHDYARQIADNTKVVADAVKGSRNGQSHPVVPWSQPILNGAP